MRDCAWICVFVGLLATPDFSRNPSSLISISSNNRLTFSGKGVDFLSWSSNVSVRQNQILMYKCAKEV